MNSRMRSSVGIRILVLCLVAAHGAHATEGDPRLAEASALLADASTYDAAAELYREVLSDDPDHTEARTWLARVLAWQGRYEESLEQYDALVEREGAPETVQVERAEVLSWAGRYGSAESAFRRILQRDPADARAARGLARVFLWSGRLGLAEDAFEYALSLEEDPEASRQLADIRRRLSWQISTESDYLEDSDGFSRLLAHARAAVDLDFSNRIVTRIGTVRAALDREGAPPPGGSRRDDDLAIEAVVGIEHAFDSGLEGRLEAGFRHWLHAPTQAIVGAQLEMPLPTDGVATFRVDHGDFLARSGSLDAVAAGIRDTTLRLATWNPVTGPLAVFGWAESSLLSDANQRVATGLSFDVTPWPEYDVTLSLSGSYLTYMRDTRLYYDPEVDTSGMFSVQASHPLVEGLSWNLRANTGVGYSRQDGADGTGITWGVGGGPDWEREDGWWVSLRGRVSRSQRVGTYEIYGFNLGVGKAF